MPGLGVSRTEMIIKNRVIRSQRARLSQHPQRIDVHPRGVLSADTPTRALAIRDRLNALLSNMIHQHKHIELHDVRARDDGSYDATIVVNGTDVASDPLLTQLEK